MCIINYARLFTLLLTLGVGVAPSVSSLCALCGAPSSYFQRILLYIIHIPHIHIICRGGLKAQQTTAPGCPETESGRPHCPHPQPQGPRGSHAAGTAPAGPRARGAAGAGRPARATADRRSPGPHRHRRARPGGRARVGSGSALYCRHSTAHVGTHLTSAWRHSRRLRSAHSRARTSAAGV